MATPAALDPLTLVRSTAGQFEQNSRFECARTPTAGLRDTRLRQQPNYTSSSTHSLPLTEPEPAPLHESMQRAPGFELHIPEQARVERQAPRPLSKELYSTLPDGHFRLLRIVPGTRRGEYTSQLLEASTEYAASEHEYSVLQVVSEGEETQLLLLRKQDRQNQHDKHPLKPGTQSPRATVTVTEVEPQTESTILPTAIPASIPSDEPWQYSRSSTDFEFWHRSTNDDTVYFPLLSLGGGEHTVEIPFKVKRALEHVVVARWDSLHSGEREEREGRACKSRGKGVGDGVAVEDGNRGADVDVDVDDDGDGDGDGDGDSDSGQGEDLYLWVREVCVDRMDMEDREQQQMLEDKIWENAREVVVVRVSRDVSGKVEVERTPVLDSVIAAVHEAIKEIREGISNDPKESNAQRTSQDMEGKGGDLSPPKALKI